MPQSTTSQVLEQRWIVSPFRRPEVQNQGVGSWFFLGDPGKMGSLPLLASGGGWRSLALLGLEMRPPQSLHPSARGPPLSGCPCLFVHSYEDISHIGLEPILTEYDLILSTYICKDPTAFTGTRCVDMSLSFRGTRFDPCRLSSWRPRGLPVLSC